ncbi:MAG: hypothetical protein KL787_06500, partial [Taibaiella sp.]|nr:hypothetical protein [Taibaiella sp.]
NRFYSDRLWGRPISDIVFDRSGNALINTGIDTLYFVDRTKSQIINVTLGEGITCGNLFKVSDSLGWVISPNGSIYSFNFNEIALKRLPEVFSVPLTDKQILNQKPAYTSNFTVYQSGTGKGIISLEQYTGFWDIPVLNFTQSNSIRGIYEDETYGLYLGTYGEGFLRVPPGSGTKDVIHPTLYPYAFLKWSADSLILAAEGLGLFWLDMRTSECQPLFLNFDLQNKRHITSIQRMGEQELLISCYEGLYVINVYTHTYYDVPVPKMDRSINVQVYSASIIGNKIWIAASNGLYCFAYAFENGIFTLTRKLYVSELQIPFTAIQLYRGSVYASSLGHGVFVVDTAALKELYVIGVNDNLISNSVYSMVISGDYLMAGTNNGLSILDLKTRHPLNFTMGSGLPHNEFNTASTLVSGEEVYMGTVNGLIKFNPRAIVQSRVIRKPYLKLTSIMTKKKGELRSFKDFTVLYQQEKPIEIPGNVDMFSLNFGMSSTEGINHIDKLYYRLGENESWGEMQSNQELRFGGMMPGDYVLQIATLNPDKSVKEVLYESELVVRPVFTQSRWFYLLLIALGGALGWGGFAYRKYLKHKEAKLRTNIAEDLHDEVGGILTELTMQADYWQYMEGTQKDEIAKKITESGREAINSMHDIVWGFYEQDDNTVSLILRIKEYVQSIPDTVKLKIKVNIDERKLAHLTGEERRNIWLIFKEAITNIIKHAEATEATVSFDARKPDYQWMLRIEDNGRGITNPGSLNGNGLKNIKNRAARIKAKLMIEPGPWNGTSIILAKA